MDLRTRAQLTDHLVGLLVAAGLLVPERGGYRIVGWPDDIPSPEEVERRVRAVIRLQRAARGAHHG